MPIADRIQHLRKQKGVTQEEPAEVIGVSRQAVSKWESGQSIPDLEKVLLLSAYFEVTTDSLLKGDAPPAETTGKMADASAFAVAATSLNVIGVAAACALWQEQQTPLALAVALLFMAPSCLLFYLGMLRAAEKTKKRGKRLFWSLNIWQLVFIPLSCLYNGVMAGIAAPYPLLVQPLAALPIFWAVYLAVCLSVTLAAVRKKREK